MAKKKQEVSIIRSSAAEYLTFVAASGQGGVESVIRKFRITASDKKVTASRKNNLCHD